MNSGISCRAGQGRAVEGAREGSSWQQRTRSIHQALPCAGRWTKNAKPIEFWQLHC